VRFGSRVADIVEGCSDASPVPGEARRPWLERKRRTSDSFERLAMTTSLAPCDGLDG
jgi:hypothetical protein